MAMFRGVLFFSVLLLGSVVWGDRDGLQMPQLLQPQALVAAARGNHVNVVKELLKHPELNVNVVDEEGDTALVVASRAGFKRIVKLLLSHPDIDPNKPTQEGLAPLHLAAAPDVGYFYHDHRADQEGWLRKQANNAKYFYALLNGHPGVVELLLQHEKTNANVLDENSATPLIKAFGPGTMVTRKASIEKLLEADGVDVNAVATFDLDEALGIPNKGTALMAAIVTHHFAVALPLCHGCSKVSHPLWWILGKVHVKHLLGSIKKLLKHPDLDIDKKVEGATLDVLKFSQSIEDHIVKNSDWSTPEGIARLKSEAKKLRNLLSAHGAAT